MASIRRFEDIEAGQEARELTKVLYRLTRHGGFGRDRDLAGQLQQAAVSIMSSIAGGFDSRSRAGFARFLGYARRFASAVQCHVHAAIDQEYVMQSELAGMYEHAQRVRRMVTSFIKYLRAGEAGVRDGRRGTVGSLARQPMHRPTRRPANPETR